MLQDPQGQRTTFRALHEQGCFILPNPWDIGSAIYLAHLGFDALATTSAGFAYTRGLPDTADALDLETVLKHTVEIVNATALPVNADFQAGYAETADGVAKNVKRCIETGVAGLSIEDATGEPDRPLFDFEEAVERVAAARDAIDGSGTDTLLTARAECFLVDQADPLGEAVRRLHAFADAGADVLYAPGLTTHDQVKEIVAVAGPLPVNVLISAGSDFRVPDLAELGVRRISLGSALARAAWGGFIGAASGLQRDGGFASLDRSTWFEDLDRFFPVRIAP